MALDYKDNRVGFGNKLRGWGAKILGFDDPNNPVPPKDPEPVPATPLPTQPEVVEP